MSCVLIILFCLLPQIPSSHPSWFTFFLSAFSFGRKKFDSCLCVCLCVCWCRVSMFRCCAVSSVRLTPPGSGRTYQRTLSTRGNVFRHFLQLLAPVLQIGHLLTHAGRSIGWEGTTVSAKLQFVVAPICWSFPVSRPLQALPDGTDPLFNYGEMRRASGHLTAQPPLYIEVGDNFIRCPFLLRERGGWPFPIHNRLQLWWWYDWKKCDTLYNISTVK